MSAEVSFREATAQDAPAILALMRKLEQETEWIEFDQAVFKYNDEKLAQNLALIQQSPTNFLLLSQVDDQLIGIVTLMETDFTNHTAELGVGVLKEVWNQGVGTALVDEALYWAENFSQLAKIWLDVVAENQGAIHVYQKLGFEIKKSATQDERGRNLIEMEYQLN